MNSHLIKRLDKDTQDLNHSSPNDISAETIDPRDLGRFLWRARTAVLLGMVTGAVFAGLFGFMQRKADYVSKLVLEVDGASLPAIRDTETINKELDRLFQSSSRMGTFLNLMADQIPNSEKLRSKIDQILYEKMSIKGSVLTSSLKLSANNLIRFEPQSEDFFLVTMRLPVNGLKDNFGTGFMVALNKMIDERNKDDLTNAFGNARASREDLMRLNKDFSQTSEAQTLKIEKVSVRIRSQLAGLEFDLQQAQKLSGPLVLGKELTNPIEHDASVLSKKNSPIFDRLGGGEVSRRIDRIIQLASALNRQGRLSEEKFEGMLDDIGGLSFRFSSLLNESASIEAMGFAVNKRVSDTYGEGLIDRRKVFLPLFKLDYARVNDNTLEELVYSLNMRNLIVGGLFFGGLLGLLLSFLILSFRKISD